MKNQVTKHVGGRPTKYEYSITEIKTFSFINEFWLNKQLIKDIGLFMKSVFDEEVIYATDKKFDKWNGVAKLKSGQVLPVRGVRLDMWVECKSGRNYILEIKNPKNANYETFRAIGQILGYSIKFPKATNYVIISTSYDEGFAEVIKKYNLPIDFVLINEDQIFLLKK